MPGHATMAVLLAGLALAGAAPALQAATAEPGTAAPAAPLCAAPVDLVQQAEVHLPALAAKIKARQPVRIVAVGGASTAGKAAASLADAYPERLRVALVARFPDLPLTVINKGVPHRTAEDMQERFDKEVIPERPDLVIWETGTTDAVRTIDPEEFDDALVAGIEQLRAHGIEVMLMDMQYSRRTASVIGFERYLEAMQRAAEVEGVPLFQRFALMHYWSDGGVFDFEHAPKGPRAGLAARVYDCIGRELAAAIAADVE